MIVGFDPRLSGELRSDHGSHSVILSAAIMHSTGDWNRALITYVQKYARQQNHLSMSPKQHAENMRVLRHMLCDKIRIVTCLLQQDATEM